MNEEEKDVIMTIKTVWLVACFVIGLTIGVTIEHINVVSNDNIDSFGKTLCQTKGYNYDSFEETEESIVIYCRNEVDDLIDGVIKIKR